MNAPTSDPSRGVPHGIPAPGLPPMKLRLLQPYNNHAPGETVDVPRLEGIMLIHNDIAIDTGNVDMRPFADPPPGDALLRAVASEISKKEDAAFAAIADNEMSGGYIFPRGTESVMHAMLEANPRLRLVGVGPEGKE